MKHAVFLVDLESGQIISNAGAESINKPIYGGLSMQKITQSLIYVALLVVSATSHAATLQSGDVLQFTANSYVEGDWGGNQFIYDSASLTAQDGLIIGAAQPSIPGIDQTWNAAIAGITGNHRTTTGVTAINDSTLDFTGWTMTLGGSEDYTFGAQQNIADYTFDGTNFILDYNWDWSYNGTSPLGPVGVTAYHLHLEGVVVPVPAAVWLFGSGLLGLIGIARRKKAA